MDFYSPEYRVGIEVDGGQHYGDKGRKRDELRTKGLNRFGVEILRFSDVEILTDIEGGYETIKTFLDEKRGNTPSSQSSPQWREEVKRRNLTPLLEGDKKWYLGKECSVNPCGTRVWGWSETLRLQVNSPKKINMLGVL